MELVTLLALCRQTRFRALLDAQVRETCCRFMLCDCRCHDRILTSVMLLDVYFDEDVKAIVKSGWDL